MEHMTLEHSTALVEDRKQLQHTKAELLEHFQQTMAGYNPKDQNTEAALPNIQLVATQAQHNRLEELDRQQAELVLDKPIAEVQHVPSVAATELATKSFEAERPLGPEQPASKQLEVCSSQQVQLAAEQVAGIALATALVAAQPVSLEIPATTVSDKFEPQVAQLTQAIAKQLAKEAGTGLVAEAASQATVEQTAAATELGRQAAAAKAGRRTLAVGQRRRPVGLERGRRAVNQPEFLGCSCITYLFRI